MGIRAKFAIVTLGIGAAVCLASYLVLERSHQQLIEQEALRVAQIVSTQIVSDRAEYTETLVGKLKREGTGAVRDYHDKPGFIPLPAQFVRNVSQRVAEKSDGLYRYSLISAWNLNPEQGLENDFDRWAWAQLAAQDRELGSHPAGDGGYVWQSVSRFETADGRPMLRFLKADPASAESCVSCHNNLEKSPEVVALREQQGVPPGKQWTLHQLMGAIRVDVPVDEVAKAAAAGRNRMLGFLALVFTVGFALLFALIQWTVIRPIESSVRDVEGFSRKVSDVVSCSQRLLLGADEQLGACRNATSVVVGASGTNGHAGNSGKDADIAHVRDAIDSVTAQANQNAKSAEESAVFCNELDDAFGGLRARLQLIIGAANA